MSEALRDLEDLDYQSTEIKLAVERLKLRNAISDGGYNWLELDDLKHKLKLISITIEKVINHSTKDYN